MSTGNLPLVSLVIPARNEAKHLPALLDSIAAVDYPLDRLEVLVVDGASTDGTAAIALSYQARIPGLRVVPNPRMITPCALNAGIRASHGELIGMLSGHCVISREYVSETVRAFTRLGAQCVGGTNENVGDGFWGGIVAKLISSSSAGNAKFRHSDVEQRVDTVTGTYQRVVFQRIGLYDERLLRNQDNEFNARLRRAGGAIYLVPTLHLRYKVRSTLLQALRQFFANGKWTVYAQLLHPYAMSARHFAPLGLILGVALLGGLSLLLSQPLIVIIPAILYAMLLVRVAAGAQLTVAQWCAAMCALPLIHLSYGVGSLVGLVTGLPFLWRARSMFGIPRFDPQAVSGKASSTLLPPSHT
jgi:glycosyltransferase involved in cell wall biosynthesis